MYRHRRHRSHSVHQRGPRVAVALSLTLLLLAGAPASGAEAGPGPEPVGRGPEFAALGAGPDGLHPEPAGGPGPWGTSDAGAAALEGDPDVEPVEPGEEWDEGPGDEDQDSWGDHDSWEDQGPGENRGEWEDWEAGGPDQEAGREPGREPRPEAEPRREREEQRREPEQRRRPSAAPRFKGWGFDTCHTQSTDTMRRWRASRYRAVGVYFGGRGRACPHQPLLTHKWMKTVKKQGWKVLPLYVGSQSNCVSSGSKRHVTVGRHPWKRGKTEAADAVRRAKAIGIQQGSPLYLDVEAYNHRDKKCAASTLTFVRGWNREVRARGYLPGFYSSAATGVKHMETARRAGVKDLPSVLWFARWRVKPQLAKEPVLARGAWPKGRIHQYAGNVRERHGGRTVLIDRNAVDAPVARVG
ncbi:glycoside hydrolase domain-containing protein [Streptomyces sp. NPDC054842]